MPEGATSHGPSTTGAPRPQSLAAAPLRPAGPILLHVQFFQDPLVCSAGKAASSAMHALAGTLCIGTEETLHSHVRIDIEWAWFFRELCMDVPDPLEDLLEALFVVELYRTGPRGPRGLKTPRRHWAPQVEDPPIRGVEFDADAPESRDQCFRLFLRPDV